MTAHELPRDAGPGRRARYLNAKRVTQIVGVVVAAVSSAYLMFLSTYSRVSVSSDGSETSSMASIWEINGPSAILTLGIPVLIAAVPLFVPRRGWQSASIVSTVLLGLFSMLALFSVGVFYLPCVIAGLIAIFLPPRNSGKDAAPR